MADYRAAIIGCGRRGQGRGGAYGIAEAHARAYERCEKTVLVAAADIDDENLGAFTADHGTHAYRDYHDMLEQEHPDIVSVCTWPALHAPMTVDAAHAGAKAVWCEKPMALSMADVDLMIEACRSTGTVLQVNHLRRFGGPFQAAYRCIQSGRIGNLIAIEVFVPDWDLLTWGTHWVRHDPLFRWRRSGVVGGRPDRLSRRQTEIRPLCGGPFGHLCGLREWGTWVPRTWGTL